LSQFHDWGHDENEIPDKTTIKLGHVVENLNVLGGFLFRHVGYGCDLLRIW
jgi:hypothetical protein